jgi:hypothetical protein
VNLKTYAPRTLPETTLETLAQEARQPRHAASIRQALLASHKAGLHYQSQLMPVFREMHENRRKPNNPARNAQLIATARRETARMTSQVAEVRSAWQRVEHGGAGHELVRSLGCRLGEQFLRLMNEVREVIDLTEGYERARVEKNLSYLTKANQDRFNRQTSGLDAAAAMMVHDFDALAASLEGTR